MPHCLLASANRLIQGFWGKNASTNNFLVFYSQSHLNKDYLSELDILLWALKYKNII